MRLVDDDILEGKLLESRLLNQANLICRNEHIEILGDDSSRDAFRTILFGASKKDGVNIWCPSFELSRPILKSRLRYDDEMLARSIPEVFEVAEEGYCLEGFTQTLREKKIEHCH